MKKFLSFAIAAAFLVTAPGMALAKDKGAKKHGDKGGISGKVTAVDTTAKTVAVDTKKDGAKTFNTTDATTVTVDGAAATLADVKVGMHAKITEGATPGTAATIEATKGEKKDKGEKKKKKDK